MRLHDLPFFRPAALLVALGTLVACRSSDLLFDRAIEAEGALGPYSGAQLVGDFAFVSGKIGERGDTFAHEVETCIDRVEEELERAWLGIEDVVDVTVFLDDIENYAPFNEIYGARFVKPYPSRACVQVAALPAGARVEIKVTARRGLPRER